MKTRIPLWMAVLSVVMSIALLASVLTFGPIVAGKLSPHVASAEVLPPETSTPITQLQATATLHILSIPPAAFVPQQPSVNWSITGTRVHTNSGIGYFQAPVYLPQGAIVTKMVVFGYDNDATAFYEVGFSRTALSSESSADLGRLNSSIDNAGIQKGAVKVSQGTINNGTYGYYVWVYLTSPNVSVKGIKLLYYY